jgi:DNA-binding MltR family transcriptional regulator
MAGVGESWGEVPYHSPPLRLGWPSTHRRLFLAMRDDLPQIDLGEALRQLSENAEAGTALVTVAAIDKWLQELLLARMQKISNTVASRIFGSIGPLYEVAPKADMAYAFGLIDEATLANLRVLRDIRNEFAHTTEQIHFSTDVISSLCKKFSSWTQDSDNHSLFMAVAADCVRAIDAKIQQIKCEKAGKPDAS